MAVQEIVGMKLCERALAILIGSAVLALPLANARAQKPVGTDSGSAVVRSEGYAEAAFEAYGRQEFAEAVALYKQAHAAAPSADLILYNIARIYDLGLHDRARAIEYYERYAAAPNAEPERIETVQKRIAELAASQAPAVNEDAALLQREPGTAGSSVAGPEAARAEPGTVPVELDHQPARSELDSASPPPGSEAALELPARNDDTGAIALAPRPPESPPWTSLEVTALALGGMGVTAAAIGVGFALSASAEAPTWRRDCEGNVCASQQGVNAAESAAQKARVAAVGVFAGAALVAVGGVLWFVRSSDTDATLNVVPVASPSELGGALRGRF